jgi:uncharacterized protein
VTAQRPLDWIVDEFARDVPGVRHAVVVSTDGLQLAASGAVAESLGDQLAAAASGLTSLGRGTAHLLGSGPVTQIILEMQDGYLFVTNIQQGAALAVHADRRCDMGVVAYEMTLLASRVGHAMAPGLRAAAGEAQW